MRRFIRRPFSVCSVVSLSLCVAASVLWARSWFVSERLNSITWDAATGRWSQRSIQWDCGRVFFDYRSQQVPVGVGYRERPAPGGGWKYERMPMKARRRDLSWRVWHAAAYGPGPGRGFVLDTYDRSVEFYFALWPLMLLCAIPPATWWVHHRRVQGKKSDGVSTCVRCGYDLRASPDRCPECGTPAAKQRRRPDGGADRIS